LDTFRKLREDSPVRKPEQDFGKLYGQLSLARVAQVAMHEPTTSDTVAHLRYMVRRLARKVLSLQAEIERLHWQEKVSRK
jgi:hypothetical protein